MKKTNLILLAVILISCQKQTLDTGSINGPESTSNATLRERIGTLKHVGKYSDTCATARNGDGIVVGGNSQAERWLYYNWAATIGKRPMLNRGLGGTTWREQIPYIDSLFTCYKPRVIVLYQGENEYLRAPVTTNKEIAKTINPDFLRFYDTLRAHNPKARIIIVSMAACPVLIGRGYNADINYLNTLYKAKLSKDSALTHNVTRYVEINSLYRDTFKFGSDQIHFNTYIPWNSRVLPAIDSVYK